VVFSDIESSTELAVALGDTRWFELLGEHHRLVTAHVDAHRGRIVKNQGDGYMLCFRSARQALLACIGLQRDLDRASIGTDLGEQLRVRMGAHTGEVMMQDDGDLFGKHVIVAARIGALAEGGQVLVSNLVKQIAEPRGDIPFGPAMEARLKGIEGPTLVHEIDWVAAHPEGAG
jgi:class 3 adenylate cyclase